MNIKWIKKRGILLITIFFMSSQVANAENKMQLYSISDQKQFEDKIAQTMENMMKKMHSKNHSNNPDLYFLELMIPHHEAALEMAKLILIYGKDPLVRQLAEEIIASQTTEIESMKKRLELLKKNVNQEEMPFPALKGLRGN